MSITLSQKETMLLKDQKKHEELCIKKYTKYSNEAQDPQLKQLFNSHATVEGEHLNSLNQILSGQVPAMSQQQQPQSGMAQASPAPGPYNANDADLCQDMLTTEKYVSGSYDTVIFECADRNVRQVLNHIQKEEQQHGEELFAYMKNHGMYQIQ